MSAIRQFVFPAGAIIDYAGSTAPNGWLLCYGQAVSRTTFAILWGVLGTTYGPGDGSTTFSLPDLRGRVAAGKDDMGGTVANRLLVSMTGNTTSGSSSITGLTNANTTLSKWMNVIGPGIPAGTVVSSITSATAITTSINATATATGVALRFGQVDGATLGATGGSHVHSIVWDELANHYHTIPQMITAGGAAAFVAGTYNIFNAGNTGATGSDQPHRNVQPTMILNKIIKY